MNYRVIEVKNHNILIENDNFELINAQLKGSFKQEIFNNTNFIKVGDFVAVKFENNQFWITKILSRKNKLSRKLPGSINTEQVIAANIDLILLVTSFLEPSLKTGVIDRYIVAAELFHIPIGIFFNKADLVEEKKFKFITKYYKEIVDFIVVGSTNDSKTIFKLTKHLKNKIVVISGQSGVGKSTLINKYSDDLNIKTNEISEYNQKGQHTTSSAFFYRLKNNIKLIDTPGIKEYSLTNVESRELYRYFPEIFFHSKKCKFFNCMHINEPNCNVISAVASGIIADFRYDSYLLILSELKNKEKNKY